MRTHELVKCGIVQVAIQASPGGTKILFGTGNPSTKLRVITCINY